MKTSVPVRVGKEAIRVISLEGLIVAKHRAGRSQDIADLRQLMARRGQVVKWDKMSQIGTNLELAELRQVAKALGS